MVACISSTILDVLPPRDIPSLSLPACKHSFTSNDALSLLQKCRNFKQMKQIHAPIIRNGLVDHHLISTKLIRLCSSYGKVDYATFVFQLIQEPSTFTWNLLIRAYTVNGYSKRAILLYNLMICNGVPPDKFTFPFVMKACLSCCCVRKATEVYALAFKAGFCGDVYLDNVFMDLCFKCGFVDDGIKVFDQMRGRNVVSWTTVLNGLIASRTVEEAEGFFYKIPRKNVVSWTAMINCYAKSGKPEKAFELFAKMQHDNVRPNEYTLVGLLVASAQLGSLKLGAWVHDFAIKNGFEIGVFLGTALVDMYSKCGSLEYARRVFQNMEIKSLAAWNAMITSLGVHGCGQEALALFEMMEKTGMEPDAITFVGVLSACLQTDNLEKARRYFSYMNERYGITPITEHYACMVNIYGNLN